MNSTSSIELLKLRGLLTRNWRLFISTIILSGGASLVISALTKPIWKGEFEILIASSDSELSAKLAALQAGNPLLSSLGGLGGIAESNKLSTQVRILSSPSVLRPVYDYVKRYKSDHGGRFSLTFREWQKKSLQVELVKGTNVLSISYADNSKQLVNAVLSKISSEYKIYSGKSRNRSINDGLDYTRAQLAIYTQKALSSAKELDELILDYGIIGSQYMPSSSSPEKSASANLVLIPEANSRPISKLARINQEIVRRRTVFKENDPSLKALIKERDFLQDYLESTAGGTISTTSSLDKEKAQRVVLDYKELARRALRDYATLSNLESTLRELELEQARASTPWELISIPSIDDRQISPRPVKNLALGVLSGLFIGGLLSLFLEKRGGRIYEIAQVVGTLDVEPLACLSVDSSSFPKSTISYIQKVIGSGSLFLVPMDECSAIKCDALKKVLSNDGTSDICVENSLLALQDNSVCVLVATSGILHNKDLEAYRNELRIFRGSLVGLIWFT